jgi:hypothetical protein
LRLAAVREWSFSTTSQDHREGQINEGYAKITELKAQIDKAAAAVTRQCQEQRESPHIRPSGEGYRCPVSSYNEWDPLEEVVVGRLEGATIPPNHIAVTFSIPARVTKIYRLFAGRRYPRVLIRAAQKELDEFIDILESEGVVVRRPDVVDCSARYRTPSWASRGFCTACPRDVVSRYRR